MSLQSLVVIVSGYCIGVGLESLFNTSAYEVVWVLFFALVMSVLWRRADMGAPSAPHLLLVSVFLITCALGLMRTGWYEQQFTDSLSSHIGREVTISGIVTKEPDRRAQQQFINVRFGDSTIQVSTDREVPVSYGDIVEVTGKLKRPEAFETDFGRTFNYPGYLKAKGVEYTVSFAKVIVTDTNQGNFFISGLLVSKQQFMTWLDHVLTEPVGSLADGLLLGLNQGLGEKLEEDFRRSGIIHIVVLSGYNIMLVVTFVLFFLSFFLTERWRMVAGLIAIISFALIVGLSATVVRASIMAGLLLVAQTFRRSHDVLRALLIAGFVMLIINPYLLLFDIGFQLSFMATLGLIAALPWLEDKAQPELLTSIKGYVVATIATQIAVLPLLLYHIGQVSLVAVIVNVLVLPVVPFAMLGAFVSAILYSLFPFAGLMLGAFTQFLLAYIIVVAEWFSALPVAAVTLSEISAVWIVGMYGIIVYGYFKFALRPNGAKSIVSDWQIVEEDEYGTAVVQSTTAAEKELPKMFR